MVSRLSAPAARASYAYIVAATALIVVGIALRLDWALTITPGLGSEARWYQSHALSLANGEGYHEDGLPTAYHPIGYPAFLALLYWCFGPEPVVGRLGNTALSLVTLVGVHGLAFWFSRSRSTALAALGCFVFYPADIGFIGTTLSELLFNALALAGTLCFVRRRARPPPHVLAAGALFGLASLTRQQGVVLPVLCALAALVSDPPRVWLKDLSALGLSFALVMAPWSVRNAERFGAFIPIATNGGMNLYIGNNPYARGCYKFEDRMRKPFQRAIAGPLRGGPNELLADRLASELAFDFMRRHPDAVRRLWPLKLSCLFAHDVSFRNFQRRIPEAQGRQLSRLKSCAEGLFVPLLWLGGVGAALSVIELTLSARLRRAQIWFPAAVIASFVLLHLLTFGDPRFHHPIMPWWMIFVGHALSAPLRWLRACQGRPSA